MLFGAGDGAQTAGPDIDLHRLHQLAEQRHRQLAVDGVVVKTLKIRSGPSEAIQFRGHDPASPAVQAELCLHRCGKFYRVSNSGRRAVRDRRDQDLVSILFIRRDEHDGARTVLSSLFVTTLGFPEP
ncbi:MAG: hypothetical protein BGO82_01535 [Devosia sp. 67-54]|nr:MAG: hypothetical protein BGO82_01535 [Devosia sp. 67-54]